LAQDNFEWAEGFDMRFGTGAAARVDPPAQPRPALGALRLCYFRAMTHLRHLPLPLLLAAAACAPEPPPGPETDVQPHRDEEWAVASGGRLVLSGATLTFEAGEEAEASEASGAGEDAEAAGAASGRPGENVPRVTILAEELVGEPAIAADGARWALSRKGPGPGLSVLDGVELGVEGLQQTTLITEGAPDRVAISADGQWLAWVSGATGIASVWAMPFAGGPAVQLTNRDLVRVPGVEPVGFVPPPHLGPLLIEDDVVRWTSPAGPHEVPLP
jgi:hypothetical protein